MKDGTRGVIKRILVELEYPNGDQHTRVIEGNTLDRLALIAFTGKAIQDHLGTVKDQDKALRTFSEGYDEPERGRPAMLLLFADGSYSVECDWQSHHAKRRL